MERSDLHFGCFDTGIGDVLAELWNKLPAFDAALIRCLDSQRDAATVAAVLGHAGISVERNQSCVAVDASGLAKALHCGHIFCGFDELWLRGATDPLGKIPNGMRLTSDGGPITASEVRQIGDVMRREMVSLILADGCGLNCVTSDLEFWKCLEAKWGRIP